MTTYFITRHPGAVDWAQSQGIHYDQHTEHLLAMDQLKAGDVVIGTLPINMVFELNSRGVRYQHLALDIPRELRGIELSAEQLSQCQARLEEYSVERLPLA